VNNGRADCVAIAKTLDRVTVLENAPVWTAGTRIVCTRINWV
jgi:hypothetical protein